MVPEDFQVKYWADIWCNCAHFGMCSLTTTEILVEIGMSNVFQVGVTVGGYMGLMPPDDDSRSQN